MLLTLSVLCLLNKQAQSSKIEDFRFQNRYQTRNQATCELIRLGLASLQKETENNKEK